MADESKSVEITEFNQAFGELKTACGDIVTEYIAAQESRNHTLQKKNPIIQLNAQELIKIILLEKNIKKRIQPLVDFLAKICHLSEANNLLGDSYQGALQSAQSRSKTNLEITDNFKTGQYKYCLI